MAETPKKESTPKKKLVPPSLEGHPNVKGLEPGNAPGRHIINTDITVEAAPRYKYEVKRGETVTIHEDH